MDGPSQPPDATVNASPSIPDHTLLQPIGRGSYGEVWLARNVMGSARAVKIVWRRQFESERPYEREFAGIQRFEPVSRSADGLVHVLHIGRNDADGYFYYVMELADSAVPLSKLSWGEADHPEERSEGPRLEGWAMGGSLRTAFCELLNGRVVATDQGFFLRSRPPFDLSLDGNSIRDVRKVLYPDQRDWFPS
jgi:hypothetical protein